MKRLAEVVIILTGVGGAAHAAGETILDACAKREATEFMDSPRSVSLGDPTFAAIDIPEGWAISKTAQRALNRGEPLSELEVYRYDEECGTNMYPALSLSPAVGCSSLSPQMCVQHLTALAAEGAAEGRVVDFAVPRITRLGSIEAIELTFSQTVIVDGVGDTLEEASRRGADFVAWRLFLIESPIGTLTCALEGASREDHTVEEALIRFCSSVRR